MRNQIKMNCQTIVIAAIIIIAMICAAACQQSMRQQNSQLPALPAGGFPAKMGKFLLNGEPVMKDYSNNETSYYSAVYSSDGKNIECLIGVYSEPQNPSLIKENHEVVAKSGAVEVQFRPAQEKLFVYVVTERFKFSTAADSVEDANEIANNLPLAELKTNKLESPVNVALPPAPYNQPPKDKSDEEIDKSIREALFAGIKIFFEQNGLKAAEPRPNKLDKSTLMINVSGSSKDFSKMAKEIKIRSGESLKDVGFRQIVVNNFVEKL